MRVGFPWRGDSIAKKRQATNQIRDLRDFSGKGRYTPDPGRGPYPWRVEGQPVRDNGGEQSLDGSELEGWHICPATSHVEAIKLVYGLGDDDPYYLLVRFKDGGEEYTYVGENGRQKRLEMIYLMMESAESPGELIWSALTLEQFPYFKSGA
jgi:hypothetical protein